MAVFHQLDRIGVLASIGCALHCLAAPLVVLTLPALGGVWAHPGTHVAISAIVLPVAAMALRRGVTVHGKAGVLLAGLAGMAFVLAGTVMPLFASDPAAACECCPSLVEGENGETKFHVPWASGITMLGGALLVVSHAWNLRCFGRCRAC